VEPSEQGDVFSKCKVADFGISRLFVKDGKPMSEVGSPWWRAPEVATKHYDMSADVFSFGILLLEIILRRPGEEIRLAMTFQKSKKGEPLAFGVRPEIIKEEFKELLMGCPPPLLQLALDCCREEPTQRPSTETITSELERLYDALTTLEKNWRKKLEEKFVNSPLAVEKGLNFWTKLATGFFQYDTNKISVPLSLIGASVNARLKAKTGRALQARELQFLASIIGVDVDANIRFEEFVEFWSWYYPTEHLILHPGVLPLFRDRFIHGFVGNSLATKWIVDLRKDNTFIIRFSTTRPGCLVITCFHNTKPTHLLVQVDDKQGFVLGNMKYATLRELLSKNNLDILQYVYPNDAINSPKFEKAWKEAEEASARSEVCSQNYEVDLEDSLQQLGNYVAEFQNELNRKLKQKADGTLITPRDTKETEEFHDHSQLSLKMKRWSTGSKSMGTISASSDTKEPPPLALSSALSSPESQTVTTPHTHEFPPPTSPSRKLQISSHDNAILSNSEASSNNTTNSPQQNTTTLSTTTNINTDTDTNNANTVSSKTHK
jgi:serine/threonine protein kinase